MLNNNISFVITTFKSENTIFDCLDSLPIQVKKIVVENSKNITLKENLEKKYQNLICYPMPENLGYGKGNNFGIGKSETDYVFILNPDARLYKNSFNEICKILEDKDFSIAAPIDSEEKYNFDQTNVIEVDSVKGFAMILNKKKIGNIFFDENFFFYLEEIDLCKRIKNNKGHIILLNSKVNHLGGLSHGDKNDFEMEKSRNWHWMWSKFYYNKKHYGYIYGFINTFPSFLTAIFKIFFYSIKKNEKKKDIYKMRLFGLLRSYMLKDSNYRPYTFKN